VNSRRSRRPRTSQGSVQPLSTGRALPSSAPAKVIVPTEPPKPRTDLAFRLAGLYKPEEKTPEVSLPADETGKKDEKVHIVPKYRVSKSPRERYFANGYLKVPRNSEVTMVAFPSLETAKRILRNLDDGTYILGLLLYNIPVVVSSRDNIYPHVYAHAFRTDAWGDDKGAKKENCLVITVDSDYHLPVIAEDSYAQWSTWFEHAFSDPEGMADMLDLDVPASEWLQKGSLSLKDSPSDSEWEALRVMSYIVNKTDLVHPIFYPATIYLSNPPPLDLSFLDKTQNYVHPWSGAPVKVELSTVV
jgi:hypothetical protein